VFVSVLPDATYHYEASERKDRYIVWQEDGQIGSLYADDQMIEQVVQGTVDLFTKQEYDSLFNSLQNALKAAGITFRLESIQKEDKTKYIHYEWSWEVIYG
jgi:hypothetical protein